MKHQLPSLETLKKEKCSAAIALMLHKAYALLPDAQVMSDGEVYRPQARYLNKLAEKLVKVRTVEQFKAWGDFMLRGTGEFEPGKSIESQLGEGNVSKSEMLKKYSKIVDWLGLDLAEQWGFEQSIDVQYANAKIQTGSSSEKVMMDLIEEEEKEDRKNGKAREITAEEKKERRAQKRVMALLLHDNPEAWHAVKRHSRAIERARDASTEAEWAEFKKEEKEFVERFGLKGLRFPYMMNLATRKEGLKDMAVNLEKVARAINMPESQMGFKKRMGVFYGGAAQGSLGTYTYLTHTLYILKGMGDRATAHEWFHALDYDLTYQSGGAAMAMGQAPSFSEPHKVAAFGSLKPAQDAMINLMDGLKNGFKKGRPVETEDYIKPDGVFWTTLHNVYAKELFKWIPPENRQNALARYNLSCKKLEEGKMDPDQFTKYIGTEYDNGLELTEPKQREVLLSSFKGEVRILAGLYCELKENPDYFKDTKTSFAHWFAEQLDNQTGKDYYSIPTELIARMGEQFVFSRLGEPLQEHNTPQYVMPFETDEAMKRFGDFLDTAKETLKSEKKIAPRL
jgi:hypothetical protein